MSRYDEERADQHEDACRAWDEARTVLEDAHRLQAMLEVVKEHAFSVEGAANHAAALDYASDMRAQMGRVVEEVSGWL